MHLLARALRARGQRRDARRCAAALPHVAIDAPQGQVRIDRDNRHCYLTPRIGISNRGGGFDMIYEAPQPVKPDPYLVWQDVPAMHVPQRPANALRVVK